MIRILNRALVSGLALATAIVWCSWASAQEPGTSKDKDEALDSLIEKLAEPDRPGKPAKDAEQPGKEAKPEGSRTGTKLDAQAPAGAGKPSKPADTPKEGAGDVSSKDKELDDLLEKLGETKDEPAPDERRRGHPQPGEPSEPAPPAPGGGDKEKTKDRPKDPGLQDKDKEIDERLEEFAGKKRKKNRSGPEEGDGAMGQLIKEMREVEQRLGKPETGEDTQAKQKRIVKQIETLIEQMRQSGSSGSMAMRQVRQQGQKPGNQPGQTPGANAGGAPATKPAEALGPPRLGRRQGHLGPPPRRAPPGDGKRVQGRCFAHQARPDPPLLPFRREAEAGPGRMSHDVEIALTRFSGPRTRGFPADGGRHARARDGLIQG